MPLLAVTLLTARFSRGVVATHADVAGSR